MLPRSGRSPRHPLAWAALLLLFLGLVAVTGLEKPATAQQWVELAGNLQVRVECGHPRLNLHRHFYTLETPGQPALPLELDERLLRPWGGPAGVAGRAVRLQALPGIVLNGARVAVRRLQVASLRVLDSPAAQDAEVTTAAVSIAVPYATLLCQFPDSGLPAPVPASWFTAVMGGGTLGLDTYWRELSYDQMNLTGSAVFGWYTMPSYASYTSSGEADIEAMLADAVRLADPDVDFRNFAGINLIFNNQTFPAGGYGTIGPGRTLTLDGQTKKFRVTWIRSQDRYDQAVLAHEMGHNNGFEHSSGPYGLVYDSEWDVMSDSYIRWDPTYHYLGQGIIAYQKTVAGWIPAGQQRRIDQGSAATLNLQRLNLPTSPTGTLIVTIPINGSNSTFYTVEARKKIGFDSPLPAEGVIIHRVTGGQAFVVDPDRNGDPNDAGAVWIPGETFTDTASRITVTVLANTGTGYDVTVANDAILPTTITGRVTDGSPAGPGMGGVTVEARPIQGSAVTVPTNPDGSYSFDNLPPGLYTITPTRTDYAFDPPNRTDVQPGSVGVDFAGTLSRVPTLRIVTPNGGQSWSEGSQQSLTWSAENTSGLATLELSRDGGLTYPEVLTTTVGVNIRTFNWKVTGPATTQARVRIRANGTEAASEADFTIVGVPTLRVLAPNGGESWTQGEPKAITWTAQNVAGSVKIELSRDGGTTYPEVLAAAVAAADGAFNWTVTGPPTTQARVRITATGAQDPGDGTFIVVAPAPPQPQTKSLNIPANQAGTLAVSVGAFAKARTLTVTVTGTPTVPATIVQIAANQSGTANVAIPKAAAARVATAKTTDGPPEPALTFTATPTPTPTPVPKPQTKTLNIPANQGGTLKVIVGTFTRARTLAVTVTGTPTVPATTVPIPANQSATANVKIPKATAGRVATAKVTDGPPAPVLTFTKSLAAGVNRFALPVLLAWRNAAPHDAPMVFTGPRFRLQPPAMR